MSHFKPSTEPLNLGYYTLQNNNTNNNNNTNTNTTNTTRNSSTDQTAEFGNLMLQAANAAQQQLNSNNSQQSQQQQQAAQYPAMSQFSVVNPQYLIAVQQQQQHQQQHILNQQQQQQHQRTQSSQSDLSPSSLTSASTHSHSQNTGVSPTLTNLNIQIQNSNTLLPNNEHNTHTIQQQKQYTTVSRRKPCNCKKSSCLKLYCECFAAGEYCSELCKCRECYNNINHSFVRNATIDNMKERNPNAFKPKIQNTNNNNNISTATTISNNQAITIPDNNNNTSTSTDSNITTSHNIVTKDNSNIYQPKLTDSQQQAIRRIHNRGCHCKKSSCLKKYCECYQNNILCSENCKCIDCKNYAGSTERIQLEHNINFQQNPNLHQHSNALHIKQENPLYYTPQHINTTYFNATIKQESNTDNNNNHQQPAQPTTTLFTRPIILPNLQSNNPFNNQSTLQQIQPLTLPNHTVNSITTAYSNIINTDVVTKFARTLVHVSQEQENNINEQAVQDLLLLSTIPKSTTPSNNVTTTTNATSTTASSNNTNKRSADLSIHDTPSKQHRQLNITSVTNDNTHNTHTQSNDGKNEADENTDTQYSSEIEQLARETVQKSFAVKRQMSNNIDNQQALLCDENEESLIQDNQSNNNSNNNTNDNIDNDNTSDYVTGTALEQAQETAILKHLNEFLDKVTSVSQRRAFTGQVAD